jgi:hypothetical protein
MRATYANLRNQVEFVDAVAQVARAPPACPCPSPAPSTRLVKKRSGLTDEQRALFAQGLTLSDGRAANAIHE